MSEQIFSSLKAFDPHNAMEIRDHIIPEYLSDVFSYKGVDFVIEIPVKFALHALDGSLEPVSEDIGFTTPKGTTVYWDGTDILTVRVDFVVEGRNFHAKFDMSHDFMWFFVQDSDIFAFSKSERIEQYSFPERKGRVSFFPLRVPAVEFNLSDPSSVSNIIAVRLFAMIAPFVNTGFI